MYFAPLRCVQKASTAGYQLFRPWYALEPNAVGWVAFNQNVFRRMYTRARLNVEVVLTSDSPLLTSLRGTREFVTLCQVPPLEGMRFPYYIKSINKERMGPILEDVANRFKLDLSQYKVTLITDIPNLLLDGSDSSNFEGTMAELKEDLL